MPLYQLLTDRTLAQSSAITPTTLIHIVYTGDPSQNIAGSSYKAELGQLAGLFSGASDTFVTGGTYSAGTATFTNNTGGTFNVTGFTTGTTSSVSGDYLPLSGGTVSGATNFTNGLTANTMSASTLFVNGVQITGDTFVTGATYSAGTATFTNNQGNQFNLTGLTEPFTGGSGNCITDLYVSNIHSCSPLNINPLDEGEVYFGSTSGITIDVTNSRLGIGTSNPQYPLQVFSGSSQLYYDPTSVGGRLLLSGSTNIPRLDVGISPYLLKPNAGISVGLRAWNDTSYPGYGKVGDGHVYAGSATNGLNLISVQGTGTEDYIRFYAGQEALPANIPDIHIQGTGTTRGYVGINNSNPTTNLHVSGNTLVSGSLSATTLNLTANNNINTANNSLRFTDTNTGAGTQFNGKIEFYSSDVSGVGVKSYVGGIINSSSQGSLIFATTGTTGSLSGGTIVGERMRIDSSGNVGIGDSSPTYRLEVSTGTETADQIGFHVRNDSSKGLFIIPTAGESGYNFNTISGDTVVTTTQGEHLVVGAKDGAAFRFSGGTSSSNSGNTITTGNRIGIGTVFYDSTQQPSEALDINGSARFRAVGATAFYANLNITSDGTLTTATSDIRLKENIEPLTNSLEKLLQLSGVTYSWIGQEGKKIGFIAQEVEKVIPELVFTNNNTEDKIKGIHMDNITAVLVEAIKEQQKIIEELKVRISNLES